MKKYLIPDSNNNFTPLLLHRSALVIYVLVVFVFNIVVGQLDFSTSYAAVDASTLYSLHNSNRLNNGLASLEVNQQLVTSATNKAKAMLDSNCWDHYCPPGTSPWSFIINTGYEYIYAGENLGEGFTNSNTLMNAWMNSPSHRANVLNGNFTEIGIGFAHGSFQGNPNNTIAVVHFASKQGGQSAPKPSMEVTTKTVPKPTATRTPATPLPEPTGVPPVQIDSPGDGSILNTADPEISGTKPEVSRLELYINELKIGDVEESGVNFSFRPGKLDDGGKKLQIFAYINNSQVSQSPEVNFNIDTIAPKVASESLEISYSRQGVQNLVTINIEVDEENVEVFSSIENKNFVQSSGNVWSATFEREQIENEETLSITAQDSAGNQSILEISSTDILGTDHTLFLNQEEISRTTISGPLLGSILASGVRTKVNVLFVFFLMILFSLDFYFLNKSGLTGLKKSKSHLQISAIVILFMVMLVGGFTGSII